MELRDLYCREYKGKDCISFQYKIVDLDTKKVTRFQFDRQLDVNGNITKSWLVSVVVGNMSGQFRHLFELPFETPKLNVPLENVCKMGLYVVNTNLMEMLDTVSGLSATLLEVIGGLR